MGNKYHRRGGELSNGHMANDERSAVETASVHM